MKYVYIINLNERGEFYADVRKGSDQGKTVFEIHGFEIFDDGFMSHDHDVNGLWEYLVSLGIIKASDYLTMDKS